MGGKVKHLIMKKNLACEILRLRRVAISDKFLSAAVRSRGAFVLLKEALSFKIKKTAMCYYT